MMTCLLRPLGCRLVAVLSVLAFWGSAQERGGAAAHAATPPNLLVILADDMGYSDAGCYGGEIRTPHLDALADHGLRFTQFYSTGRCWPSRAVLLTGYYAQQVGMDPRRGNQWPAWTSLLPQHLKAAGYRSYHSGKWHVRHTPLDPRHSGFERSYRTSDHDRHFSPQRHQLDDRPLPAVQRGEGYYSTTAIATRAVEFLREHHQRTPGRPFHLYLAFLSPHFPLHAPEEDIARYRDRYRQGWDELREERWRRMKRMGLAQGELPDRRPDIKAPWSWPEEKLQEQIGPGESGHAVAWRELTDAQREFQARKMAVHAAMVDRMDQEIGRVLQQVRQMGQWDNTLILFASDNGATAEQIIRGDMHARDSEPGAADSYLCLGPGWSTAANTPLTLHKHWNHEGGIASPFIVHWPAGIRARGELRRVPGHFIDVVPTLLDVAGVSPAPEWNGVPAPPMPGTSLRPAFESEPDWEDRALYFSHAGNRALRMGDWKAVMRVENSETWELYHVGEDRAENHDLGKARPVKLRQLIESWHRLDRQFALDRGPGGQ